MFDILAARADICFTCRIIHVSCCGCLQAYISTIHPISHSYKKNSYLCEFKWKLSHIKTYLITTYQCLKTSDMLSALDEESMSKPNMYSSVCICICILRGSTHYCAIAPRE